MVNTISKLRIYKRKTRHEWKTVKCCSAQRSVDCSNLTHIKTDKTHQIQNFNRSIKVVLLSARNISNKGQLVTDYLLNNKVDLAVITEKWLKNNKADKIWLEFCN